MANPNPNNRHVVQNPDKSWGVRAADAKRNSANLSTQAEAQARAHDIVEHLGGGEVVTHNREGVIRDSRTVPPGNDPFPPRDKK